MNGIAYAGRADDCGLHADKNFSVIVAAGRCVLQYADGHKEFGAGEVAVVPPLVKYAFSGEAALVSLEQAILPFKEIRILPDDAGRGIAHAAEQAKIYFGDPQKRGVTAALGGLIAAYLVAQAGGGRLSPVVATVRGDIKKNLSNTSYSLEDSLKLLPLNYDYVRKLFKKETGATPHEYLISERMELARGLILSGIGNRYSNYSVGQIAEACGFSDPLYFSRVFKKYFKISPSGACRTWTGPNRQAINKN